MLYVNWVCKGQVIANKFLVLETSINSLCFKVQTAWTLNSKDLYSRYNKPENCERFFISTNNQLNKWVG